VIPAHNEAANLHAMVTAFVDHLPEPVAARLNEIHIVENGSTDGTLATARALELRYPGLVRALTIPAAGYGEAIKHGIEQTQGTHVAILECDALAIEFLVQSMRVFDEGRADLIVASKRHRDSLDRRPWKRRWMTRGFNLLLRTLVGYPGSDTHGLKSIEVTLARRLCQLSVSTSEVVQSELVLLAWRLGHRVVELPIDITEVRSPSVGVLRRIPRVIPILWQLRKSLRRFPRPPKEVAVVEA
jgi:glycosyltransferase involved in cell wall biosynthesis